LNGSTYGMVDGFNPVNMGAVGGAGFFVDEMLEPFDSYAIYWQYDDADNDGTPDYPASVPAEEQHEAGQLLLFGKVTTPARGVYHVHMTSTAMPTVTAEIAIFPNLGEDNVSF